MSEVINKHIRRFFVILATLGLFAYYVNYSKSIPFSYYDEFWWVNDSYLAQYYFEGDFDDSIWRSTDAIDQPMLTRLVFAITLYPQYIHEKSNNQDIGDKADFTYSKFLISNGFIYSNTNNLLNEEYLTNIVKTKHYLEIKKDDTGFEKDFISSYGDSIINPIRLIQKVRNVNALFLTLSVFFLFLFFKKDIGRFLSALIALFFGLNPIIMETGLKAHSEGLFVLLFILSLCCMIRYFNKPKFSSFILIPILIGFTVSTKLNGIILYPIFITSLYLFNLLKKIRNNGNEILIKAVFLGILIFIIFVSLNPFTYSSPISKTFAMYQYRNEISTIQQRLFGDVSLYTSAQKVEAIYNNLFANQYEGLTGVLLFLLFLFGLYYDLYKATTKISHFAIFVFITFIITFLATFMFLKLNWIRYYVLLIPLIIYYQVSGVHYFLNLVRNRHLD